MRASIYLLIILAVFPAASLFAQQDDSGIPSEPLEVMSIRIQERQARAQSLFELGKELFRQQKYEQAEEQFAKAVKLDPEHSEASRALVQVRSILGSRRDSVYSQSEFIRQQKVIRDEEIKVELEHLIRIAKAEFERIRLDLDRLEPDIALERLESNKNAFVKAAELAKTLSGRLDRESYRGIIEGYIDQNERLITQVNAEISRRQRIKSKRLRVMELEENEEYLRNRIRNLIKQIEEQIEQEKYTSAMKLADDVLLIDPSNALVQSMREQAQQLRHEKQTREAEALQKKEITRRWLQIKEASIPYSDTVVYPDDWNFISSRQSQTLTRKKEPEWQLEIKKRMDQVLRYSCPGLPLKEVLSQLSDITGLNIILDPAVDNQMSEDDKFISQFELEGMKLRYILSYILRLVNLTYVLKDDAIMITSPESIVDRLVVEIYDVQDLLSEKRDFSTSDLSIGGLTGGLDIGAVDAAAGDSSLTGSTLIDLFRTHVPAGRWDDTASGVNLRFLGSAGSILVKNTPSVHNQIIELLQTLRKTGSLQVEVEARLLNIRKNFFRDIGVDWRGLDRTSLLEYGDSPEPGYVSDRTATDVIDTRGSVLNSLPSADSGSSLLGFFLEHTIMSSFQAKVLFRALESETNFTQLIAPRLVMVNNVSTYIRLVNQVNYISGYAQAAGEDAAGLTPQIDSVDEGQLLRVKATISSDRKYITLDVQPDFNSVTFRDPVYIRGVSESSFGNTGSSMSLPLELPIVRIEKVRTTAVIPDGGVLIIGGIAETREQTMSRGVPLISKIPFLGRLFRSDSSSDESKDTMYLIHGKIIVFDEIEAEL